MKRCNVLLFLREEMDSLQRQMEEHTVTVHESMSSWTNAEEEVTRLSLQNSIPDSSSPPNNEAVENNNRAELPPS